MNKVFQNKDKEELYLIEKQKQEEYNIETIFNKRKEKFTNTDNSGITNLTVVPDKENLLKRVFYKIKQLFHLT